MSRPFRAQCSSLVTRLYGKADFGDGFWRRIAEADVGNGFWIFKIKKD